MSDYPYNDYRNYLMHYAKGEKAKDHKYLYIDENGNYVYHKKSSGHGGGPSTLSEQFLFDARPSTWSGHGGSGRKFSSGHGGGSVSTHKSSGRGKHGGSGRSLEVSKSIGGGVSGGSGRKFETKSDKRKKKIKLAKTIMQFLLNM